MSGAREKKECRCPMTVHRHGTLACYRRRSEGDQS